MSSRYHNIEQFHAADEQVPSTSPSPPRRDPVEDADDSFTRKRQRLDDGGVVLRAMSTDSESQNRAITSPHKEMVAMTIREHSPPSPSPADVEDQDNNATTSSAGQSPSTTGLPAMMDGSTDESNSPPVIEIIDDNEDQLPASFTIQLNAEEYFKQFPYEERFRNALQALREITSHVQKNLDIPQDLLRLLAQWLDGLPLDVSTHLQSFYSSKITFWIDFADLVERLLKRRYQWITALDANQEEHMGRHPFGHRFGDDAAVYDAFSEFFSAYMRLCPLLFLVDIHLLAGPRLEEPYPSPLIAEKHLNHLHTILRTDKMPLFHLTRGDYAVNRIDLSTRLHMDFLSANGAQNLLRLADESFSKVTSALQTHIAMYVCQILETLGWAIFRCSNLRTGIDPAEFYGGALLFFRKYSENLQDPAKISDAGVARDLVISFSHLAQELCQWDDNSANSLANELLDLKDAESPTVSSPSRTQIKTDANDYRQYTEVLPVLVANAWKFKLMRKYIAKGRMELRVMSIAFMDEALVNLHKEYQDHNSPDIHPVLRYLADILLCGQVVDYIVSVDSHPQLISRSGNIAGFLVVTDRWVDSQADAVWNTVSQSPDPRVVTATVTMLRNIISMMKPSDHLYLCMKLYELPIESFTLDILRFLRELTDKLLDRHPPVDWSLRGDTARPWNVCVRLLQDTAPRRNATKHDTDLSTEVDNQFRLLAREIPESDQHSIYRRCLEQIIARSDAATGSVRAISILSSFGDATFFQYHSDAVCRLLEEIPSFVKLEAMGTPHRYLLPALQYRLELLSLMACRNGQLIPKHLYENLWDHVVGPHALSSRARDAAWAQLLQATKIAPTNDFCRQLISTYVPSMDPQYYTPGLYDFIANYDFPIARKTVQIDGKDHLLLQIPGGGLLWSLILSSPPGTIEELAARDLAGRYAHISQNQDVILSEVELAHVELVERCMKELRSASEILHRSSDESRVDSNVRFSRVLMFLKQVLELVRQKPEFNRARRADSKVESMDAGIPVANAITIRYQVGNDRQSVLIGPDRSITDLYRSLCHATGCSRINLFAGGQKLDVVQRADQKVAAANIGGQLLVQVVQRDETTLAMIAPIAGFSEFETNLVKHFDEMFKWMDADNTTSQLLFDFLTLFPYRSTITNDVSAGEAELERFFPPGKFYQAKYAAQAIHSKLKDQIRSSALDETFLVNAIKLFDRALLSEHLLGKDILDSGGLPLAAVLISAMLDFLRERPTRDLSQLYFSNERMLADRLVNILTAAVRTTDALKLTQECYAAILEASLYSPTIWETFWSHAEVSQTHRALLLADTRTDLRENIKLKILSVCGGCLPSSSLLGTADIASRYWIAITGILPDAVNIPEQSMQLFELAQHVFRVYDEHHRSEENLRSLLGSWSSWMLAYNHSELPGQYEVDNVVLGFTKLLSCLVPSLKSYKHPLNAAELITSMFNKFLFTSVIPTEDTIRGCNSPRTALPVLESSTRRELYDLMLNLAEDSQSYECLLQLCGNTVLKGINPVLHPLSVDRTTEVRSRTGYVGLHNPRAICYMNSLLAQLFMNLNFRQFMLGLEVKEGDGSQRLLLETQKLFATMQNSYRKAADPQPFAKCIMTLDKTPIDIGVQMDADEFYNLLFDQWEAQLVNERDKQRFRSFYGGQMLQQVKSKECQHVSERADSFFALQCDVQGKANLQESLQAFVQGDVMEGDNKYKCESCGGKFVDAVKRTCLKAAPDNLIFHLKRFDFDLTDFSRKKVHEHFGFPETIDIGLYNVDHLSNPSNPHVEDHFDLVGVVVHFGSCENGHYYSYVRKRPCPTGETSPTWLNFNDEVVDPFDPAEIPQKAFGGPVEDAYTRQYKLYSAYMLFYQRRTAISQDQQQWTVSPRSRPPKVDVPQHIEKDIRLNNELFVREYCLFDPCHSAFVRQLHGASRRINNGTCSDTHKQETQALDVFLTHLGRVVWRQQTTVIFEEALLHLRRFVLSCDVCCSVTLQWLAQDRDILYNLILRCPHPSIKSHTRSILVDALKFLRDKDIYSYGATTDGDVASDSNQNGDGLLALVARRLATLAETSSRNPRAWDDLYLTMTQVADMGHLETAALLDTGILDFCLQLFCMHVTTGPSEGYVDFFRAFEKRTGVYNRLIGFISTVLSRMDMNLPACETTDRIATLDHEQLVFPLTRYEKSLLLCWHNEMKAYAVVDKIVELFDETKTASYYPGDVVKWMAGSSDSQVQRNIFTMIVQGIMELNSPFCDAYLRVAACYSEAITTVEGLSKVCDTVVDAIATIEQNSDEKNAPHGSNVLRFFQDVSRLANPHLSSADAYWCLISKSHRFASPLLLYSDELVRNGTHDFIRHLYIRYMEDAPNLSRAYKCVRATTTEIIKRLAYESGMGTLRRFVSPLMGVGHFLVALLHDLDQNVDPNLASLKDDNDKALIYQWQVEVESQARVLPEANLPSPGEGAFDASDFGSESDDVELLES